MNRLAVVIRVFCFVVCRAFAQDFGAGAEIIVPSGVRLGMGVAQIKQARPAIFEGPTASSPVGNDSNTHRTFMEVQNVGAPGQLSYLYLCSHERLVGVLRTRSLVGIDPETAKSAAQQIYSQLVQQLGTARQDTLLRKGRTAFVPVRADVWRNTASGGAIYFIATDQEMTVAVVEATDFPLTQVFIRPDPQRFPIEEPDKRSVLDLERPVMIAAKSPAPSVPSLNLPDQEPNAQSSRGPVKPGSAISPTASTVPVSQETPRWSASRTLVLVFGAVVIVVFAALMRRREP